MTYYDRVVSWDGVRHQVIIFGFNRPEMIERRLKEVLKIAPPHVFVSIDYKDIVMLGEMKAIVESYIEMWPTKSSLTYRLHTQNQGLVSHISQTISESLEEYECAVIIEDDISISKGFYESALRYMGSNFLRKTYLSFGGFSIFPKLGLLEKFNIFRATPYFACWGWVIARENWHGYEIDLNNEDISLALSQSKVWNSLHKNQRATWMGRFNKAKLNPANTWDVQFQYHSFKIDKLNLVPVVRLVDNEGFSDSRGTHTQSMRPRILGEFKFATRRVHNLILPRWASKILVYAESIIFFEDFYLHPNIKKIARKFLNSGS